MVIITIGIKGPTWFPDYIKTCTEALLLLEGIQREGIYFVEYPTRLAEEISGVLGSFFTLKSDGDYVRFDGSPEFSDELKITDNFNEDFIKIIEKISFKTGPTKYSFHITTEDGINNTVGLLRDGKKFPIINPSHRTVLQCIRSANLLLKYSKNYVCFQMDIGCLDIETNKVIYKIFSYLNDKIKGSEKNLIIFYSDPSGKFAEDYLWKANCYKSFAVIDSDGSYRIIDYDESIRNIKSALEISEYKRLDLFLGAGASMGSGLPSGANLRLIALQEFTGKESDTEEEMLEEVVKTAKGIPTDIRKISLEIVMSLLKLQGKNDLTQTNAIKLFEEKYNEAKANPSEGFKIIRRISENEIFVLGVTTNFDQLLEQNLAKPKIIILDTEFESTDSQKIVKGELGHTVVKLHGCRSKPYTLGIEAKNVSELPLGKKEFMKAYLKGARPEGKLSPVFFIGYNFADPDILEILTNNTPELLILPIIVNPKKTPEIRSFIENFHEKGGTTIHIPFTFDIFMKELWNIICDRKADDGDGKTSSLSKDK